MKLFRKIRQTLIKEGNLKRFLLYRLGEILLVMIGISLAFQVNNWNDNRKKQQAEIRYYENIRDQIADDGRLIHMQIDFNNKYMAQFKYANFTLLSINIKFNNKAYDNETISKIKIATSVHHTKGVYS